jgi:cell division protein FtsN
MRHISLDESFWRFAPEALASGESIEGVESPLLDVSRLLLRVQYSAAAHPGARLGLFTLGGSEEERALGLVLAAFLARSGRRVLLVDLDFSDDTWCRLLGGEELSGVADHVAYGIAPEKLVRLTSWGGLALLPAGTGAAERAGLLRSDTLRGCLELLSPAHDLVVLGLPFDESLDWGAGALAAMDWAILLGPAGDELAFELAIPKLVRRVELLSTLDVPPLGRWRPGLAAALPALLRDARRDSAAPASSAAAVVASGSAVELAGTGAEGTSGRAAELAAGSGAGLGTGAPAASPGLAFSGPADSDLPQPLPQPSPVQPDSPQPDSLQPDSLELDPRLTQMVAGIHASRAARDSLPPRAAPDAETAADVAFLSGLGGAEPPPLPIHPKLRPYVQGRIDFASSAPATPAPELRELASGWKEREENAAEDLATGAAGDFVLAGAVEEDSGGRWGTMALALFLCLVLGAVAFWYWRSNQQIPEGQFTFVESSPGGGLDGQPAGLTDGDASLEVPAAASSGGKAAEAEGGLPGEPSALGQAEAPESLGKSEDPELTGGPGVASEMDEPRVPSPGDGGGAVGERAGGVVEGGSGEAAEVSGAAAAREGEGGAVRESETAETGERGGGNVTEEPGPPGSGPVLGFSLHVGSYQTYEAANRAAGALRQKGKNAFVVPVLLEEKGQWYRVFVGALVDGAESRAALARAQEEGAVAEGAVRETPWALYLGTYGTREEAAEVVTRLERSEISAYAVGTGPVVLYAGAFESAADAELLNRQLRDRGFDAALVRRRAAGSR